MSRYRKASPGDGEDLPDRLDRVTHRIAMLALNDIVTGGAKALVQVDRMPRCNRRLDLSAVVSSVYGQRSGNHPAAAAWECGECGQVWLGEEKALKCCTENED